MTELGPAFLEALLRTASEGVVVHDEAGRIVFCNPAAQRILGIAEGIVLGNTSRGLENVTVREDGTVFPADEHPAMVTLRTGRSCAGVVMGIRHAHASARTWITINSSVIPASGNEARMVFTAFADVTAHIEAKHSLHQAAERLAQSNRTLQTTETYLRNVLRAIPDCTWLKDPDGVYLLCNSAFESFYNASEAEILGRTDFDFTGPQQAEALRATDLAALQADEARVSEAWVTFQDDGRRALMEVIKTPVRDHAGTVIGVLGIARDVTDRKNAERQITRLMSYQRAILDNSPIGISVFDPGRVCMEANTALARIFGTDVETLIGKSSRPLYRDQATFEEIGARGWAAITSGQAFAEDVPMRRSDGAEIWVHQVAHLIDRADPQRGVILTMEDVTERRLLEDELRASHAALEKLTIELQEQAQTDSLTGLPNRRAFVETIESEFSRSRRFGSAASVLVIDIDHFKQVNDTHGHEAGDRALVRLANILKTKIRASDLAARIGGEEFVMLLPGTAQGSATVLAERIRFAASRIKLGSSEGEFGFTVSIGLAQFSKADGEWTQALARADSALYRAKSNGRNRVEA